MMLPRSRLLRSIPVVLTLLAAQTGCSATGAASAPRSPEPMSAKSGSAAPSAASMAAPVQPGGYPSADLASTPAPAPTNVLGTPAKAADTRSAKNAGPTTRAPVIIYQGDFHMMTDEDAIPKTIDKVIDVAESLGGHIAGRKDQSVQIKVPSASFREAMTKIEAIGGVVNRSVTADDVSEEFHDLEVRLGNLRSTRTRLQEFLGKANGIQDMLTVERELERVALEIDRIEGRLEFLRTRASMSVISVALTPKPKVVPIVVVTPPPPPPRNGIDLPIPWVGEVGIDPLLSLRK
jgi:hypothetical protein